MEIGQYVQIIMSPYASLYGRPFLKQCTHLVIFAIRKDVAPHIWLSLWVCNMYSKERCVRRIEIFENKMGNRKRKKIKT